MSEQQLPSLFLYIGEFDMTFESISPDVYIERLQDKKRLQSKYLSLRLLPAPDNTNTHGFGPYTTFATFALERNFRSVGVWAVGTISTHQRGDIRVSGRIGIDSWFLTLMIIAVIYVIVVALRSKRPVKMFIFLVIGLGFIFSVFFLGLYSLRGKLIDHLRESNNPSTYI